MCFFFFNQKTSYDMRISYWSSYVCSSDLLGQSGLSTRPFVLGGNVFGMTADRAASFAILDRFVECGGGMIDTADVYSAWVPGHKGGETETMMGAWLKASGARDRIAIATKVGMMPGGLTPDRIRVAVQGHPHRLGVDVIAQLGE